MTSRREPTPNREPYRSQPETAVHKLGPEEPTYELGPQDNVEIVPSNENPQIQGPMSRMKKSPRIERQEQVGLPGQANQAINLAEPGIWEALDAAEPHTGGTPPVGHGHKEAGDSTGH